MRADFIEFTDVCYFDDGFAHKKKSLVLGLDTKTSLVGILKTSVAGSSFCIVAIN